VVIVPCQEKARATKSEQKENLRHGQTWGSCIHIELVYGIPPPSEAQYKSLARLYYNFYRANANRKLIVIPHLELDRGLEDGHSDPRDFDFNKFYAILKDFYHINFIDGVDGITQERFGYRIRNDFEMKQNFPPVLKGPVEDIRGNINRKWKKWDQP
jgi:hypothetical protein